MIVLALWWAVGLGIAHADTGETADTASHTADTGDMDSGDSDTGEPEDTGPPDSDEPEDTDTDSDNETADTGDTGSSSTVSGSAASELANEVGGSPWSDGCGCASAGSAGRIFGGSLFFVALIGAVRRR